MFLLRNICLAAAENSTGTTFPLICSRVSKIDIRRGWSIAGATIKTTATSKMELAKE